jgi:phosphoribosylaminoimidazole-succinocarboxamide synthase
MSQPLLRSDVPGFPCRRGKVRDVYDLGDRLAIVTTDRISAFDHVMQSGIPDKGRVLTALTTFWLNWLGVPNHFLSDRIDDLPDAFCRQPEVFAGRTMLVRKTEVVPVECVARGYLAGSGWKEYRQSGTVCGLPLPPGLREADRLPDAIFTPATKAETGHDENISLDRMAADVGRGLADDLKARTLDVYRRAADYAADRGIILADTKLEWGKLPDGSVILIDEVLTPDSSRFWPKASYRPSGSPPSFDKQYLRDWLETTGWDKNSPPPALPTDVVERTAEKYREAFLRMTNDPPMTHQ